MTVTQQLSNLDFGINQKMLGNKQKDLGHHYDKEAVRKAASEIRDRFQENNYKGLVDNRYYKGVGAEIDPNWTLEQKLRAANLDWEVKSSPISYGDKAQFKDPVNKAVYRGDTGTLFSVVSDTWKPFQNTEVVNAFDEFCSNAGIEIERLGMLREGRLVFASAICNESWAVLGSDDTIAARLLLTNSHEYGKGLTVKLNAIRLVCCNGITRSVRLGQRTFSHNQIFDKDVVKAILQSSQQNFVNLGLLIDELAETRITNREARDLLMETLGDRTSKDLILPYDEQNNLVKSAFQAFVNHSSIGANLETSQNTAWELMNCVTEQINHHSRSVGEAHINSLWNGGKARIESKMLNSLAYAYSKREENKNKKVQTVGVSF